MPTNPTEQVDAVKWKKGFPTLDGDYYSRVDEYDKQPTAIRIESRTSHTPAAVYEFGCEKDLRKEYESEEYEYLGPISPELLKTLADKVQHLQDERDSVYTAAMIAASEGEESELRTIQECDKCDLCEDHHA